LKMKPSRCARAPSRPSGPARLRPLCLRKIVRANCSAENSNAGAGDKKDTMSALDALLGTPEPATPTPPKEEEPKPAPPTIKVEEEASVVEKLEAALPPATPQEAAAMWKQLDAEIEALRGMPPSERSRGTAGNGVLAALQKLSDANVTNAFDAATKNSMNVDTIRDMRATMQELKVAGIKDPEALGTPSTRNEATFLVASFLGTAVPATIAGYVLPGDWGFFVPYLLGGVMIVILTIGSTSPGLLQFAIDRVNLVNPDFKERALRHEAGHFLTAYLLGVPVTGYSLAIGETHTDLLAARIGRPIFQGRLNVDELSALSVIAMAGVAAEGLHYEDCQGQTADLVDLQQLLNRAEEPVDNQSQLNITRWATMQAAKMIRTHRREYTALMAAMSEGKDVGECIRAIEDATN